MIEEPTLILQPIIEADPVQFSFNTTGWKVVFTIVILILIQVVYRLYLNYKKKQYRRDAIQEILKIQTKDVDFITQLMFTLKKTALQTYGRKTVAKLYGDEWFSFLDDKVNGCNFFKNKELISAAIYKKELPKGTTFNQQAWQLISIKWIKHHA